MAEETGRNGRSPDVLEGFEPADRASYGAAEDIWSAAAGGDAVQGQSDLSGRILHMSPMVLVAVLVAAASIVFATVRVTQAYGTISKRVVQARLEREDEARQAQAEKETETTTTVAEEQVSDETQNDEDTQDVQESEPIRLGSDLNSKKEGSGDPDRIRVTSGAIKVADASDFSRVSEDDRDSVTEISIENLDSQGFYEMRIFENLQKLTVSNLTLTDSGYNIFPYFYNLKYLTIGNFTGTDLDASRLSGLESLDITVASNVQTINASNTRNLQRIFVRASGDGSQAGSVGTLNLSNATALRDITVTCSVGVMDIQYDEEINLISYQNSLGSDGVIGKVIYDSKTDSIAIQNLQDRVNSSGASGWSFEHRGI